jgi:hypothetical protein
LRAETKEKNRSLKTCLWISIALNQIGFDGADRELVAFQHKRRVERVRLGLRASLGKQGELDSGGYPKLDLERHQLTRHLYQEFADLCKARDRQSNRLNVLNLISHFCAGPRSKNREGNLSQK